MSLTKPLTTYKKFCFLTACLALVLTGCLGYEEEYLFIDIPNQVGEVIYFNIVSDAECEDKIQQDFQDLIDMAYNDTCEASNGQKTIRSVSRALYGIGSQLDGMMTFSFKDLAGGLGEFEITIDDNGSYVCKLGADEVYIGGNGTYSEHDSIKTVTWNKKSTTIELKTRSAVFYKTKTTSMLSYWLDWKKTT